MNFCFCWGRMLAKIMEYMLEPTLLNSWSIKSFHEPWQEVDHRYRIQLFSGSLHKFLFLILNVNFLMPYISKKHPSCSHYHFNSASQKYMLTMIIFCFRRGPLFSNTFWYFAIATAVIVVGREDKPEKIYIRHLLLSI